MVPSLSFIFHQAQFYNTKDEMKTSLENQFDFYHFLLTHSPRYDYSDADFCLFKYFPYKRAIFSTISKSDENMTYIDSNDTFLPNF